MSVREPAIFVSPWWRSPAGIFLPSTLKGEGQQDLPPDLPPELRPSQRPIALHAPVDAGAQMNTFVDEAAIGLSTSTLGDLEGMVASLPFEPAIEAVSILAARTLAAGRSRKAQLELAETVFPRAPILQKIRSAIQNHSAMHLFAEQNLNALMQLLIDQSDQRSLGEATTTRELAVFNRVLFAITILTDVDAADLDTEVGDGERWLPFLIQLSSYYAHPAVMTEMTRAGLMLDVARSQVAKEFNSYCPLDQWYLDHLGLDVAEQRRLMMAFAATCSAFDGAETKTHIPASAVDGLLHTADLLHKKEEALSLIAATREEYRDAFGALGKGPRRLLWEVRPFKQRPFLRCSNGDLLLLSPRFLESWFAEGFHYRALDIAQDLEESSRYSAFAGRLYETYCVELADDAHSAMAGVHVYGDRPYIRGKSGKTCDVAVDCVTDLVLVEVTNSRFKASTLTEGDREDALADLDRVLLRKCRQLDKCIDRVLAGEAPFPQDLALLKNIWPIVVSAGVPMQTPPLWNYLLKEMGDAFKQPRVRPLTLLDPEEYEILLGLVEAGTPLPDLLARKTAEPYRFLDLKAWLADDPWAPRGRGRPKMIERAYKRNTREIADGMKFAEPESRAAA